MATPPQDSYIETTLIECNRLSGIHPDDSNALWTNNLADTFHMKEGDRVSMYSSFISERGSGKLNSIELKGNSLGTKKSITYNTISQTTSFNASFKRNDVSNETLIQTTENIEMFDNKCSMVISYYKTMDMLNYVQLPRRFYNKANGSAEFKNEDSISIGRVHVEIAELSDSILEGENYIAQDHTVIPKKSDGTIDRWILINDNNKYTIFCRDNTDFIYDATHTYPPYYARDPENATYSMVRQKIDINLDKGFTSSAIISDEITRQLQETTDLDTEFGYHNYNSGNKYIQYPITKTLESLAYKTFNSTNPTYSSQANYNKVFLEPSATSATLPSNPYQFFSYSSTNDQDTVNWYRGYQYIGIKRPEIYEAGTQLNDIFGFQIINGLEQYTLFPLNPLLSTYNYLDFQNLTNADNLIQEGWYVINGDGKKINIEGTAFLDVSNEIRIFLSEPYGTDTGTAGVVIESGYTGNALTSIAASNRNKFILNLEYTASNCLKFKNFFEACGKYPELWSPENVERLASATINTYNTTTSHTPVINVNNSRFLHMNTHENSSCVSGNSDDENFITQNWVENPSPNEFHSVRFRDYDCTQLGCGYYDHIGLSGSLVVYPSADQASIPVKNLTDRVGTRPFFFHYDPLQKDKFYDNPVEGQYTYGCLSSNGKYIVLDPLKLMGDTNGCPSYFLQTNEIQPRRKIGFDRHFNAWSTCAIQLANGLPDIGFRESHANGGQVQHQTQSNQYSNLPLGTGANEQGVPADMSLTNTQIYLGAVEPTLGFDNAHFYFENLHTPLNKGYFIDNATDDGTDAGRVVYKINPPQAYNNYTPTQFPYQEFNIWLADGGDDAVSYAPQNPNQFPYAINDTTTGIFIEDFGYDEAKWESSIWGSIGFTYKQLHGDNLVRNDRIDFKNKDNLSAVTTNCTLDCVDTKSWSQFPTKSAIFDGSVVSNYDAVYGKSGDIILRRFVPNIEVPTKSIRINALEYPISMGKAYYTIRSDIVPTTGFLGGGGLNTNMPIVGIVDKENPQGDFYFGTESSLQFTITKPTVISSVSVSIHDPDGSYANASRRSAIIFRIEKLRRLTFNIGREIALKLKKGKM